MTEKGRGYGRATLALAIERAFEEHGAHRLWLDVKPHNERARSLYRSAGFVEEGMLRDALYYGGRFESLRRDVDPAPGMARAAFYYDLARPTPTSRPSASSACSARCPSSCRCGSAAPGGFRCAEEEAIYRADVERRAAATG